MNADADMNEKDPMMEKEEPPKKEDPPMEEEKKGGIGLNQESEGSFISEEAKPEFEECCCCLCVCSTDKTKDLNCCCCCPIKCGVVLIGALTIGLACYYISFQFFLILNDQTQWWFPAVNILLLVPLYLASTFWVVFFTKDELSSRAKLPYSGILTLVSIFLYALWHVIYYVAIYKKDVVYIGFGVDEKRYIQYSKKYYIFKVLLESVILAALYAYFICVTSNYKGALRKKKDGKAEE
jgi:hypothetical protein